MAVEGFCLCTRIVLSRRVSRCAPFFAQTVPAARRCPAAAQAESETGTGT